METPKALRSDQSVNAGWRRSHPRSESSFFLREEPVEFVGQLVAEHEQWTSSTYQ
jgi:hypothetical protein